MNSDSNKKAHDFLRQSSLPPPQQPKTHSSVNRTDNTTDIPLSSLEKISEFWAEKAENLLDWSEKWSTTMAGDVGNFDVRWFEGGRLNVAYNCLDRNLVNGRRNKAALIWQGDKDEDSRVYTYQMLFREVCRFANVLKKRGIRRGDRVVIYMPMIPEFAIAMLACARIGATHSVVFAGFSAKSLQDRIQDCEAKLLVTADNIVRTGRVLPLKDNVDKALGHCPSISGCIVVRRVGMDVGMLDGRDYWYHLEMQSADISDDCEPEAMEANDPLFILYTSGSTGSPKGVVHSTGGYLLYALYTCRKVFDLNDDDIHWCTADLGWITGHSYLLYGPLGLGATSLMFEGTPSYPGPDRYWQIVEKYRVSIIYTAPTVIRALMRYGTEPVDIHDLSSLRLLGSVGEPISPEVWHWYHGVVGRGSIPLIDTWWQTETGGIMIAPLHDETRLKPGSVVKPLPGIDAVVLNEDGEEVSQGERGRLVIRNPWPGLFIGIFMDRECHASHKLNVFKGGYDTGDGACCDEDGYFWITGRGDDVINVSGHRLGTAEIEAALGSHPAVAEAAVVGVFHPIKGQAVYAYIRLQENFSETEALFAELCNHVRLQIGPIATPDMLQCVSGLPKTRSGKLMRRVLKKIAADDFDNFGDTSALANPSIIDTLIASKKALSAE